MEQNATCLGSPEVKLVCRRTLPLLVRIIETLANRRLMTKRPRNSARGHPRGKHLVYVVGTGSRTTRCKKRGSNWAASRRENCQKPCKKPCDRLFWRRFAPIGPPQCRISLSAWSSTMDNRLLHLRPSGCRSIRCPRFSPRRCFW